MAFEVREQIFSGHTNIPSYNKIRPPQKLNVDSHLASQAFKHYFIYHPLAPRPCRESILAVKTTCRISVTNLESSTQLESASTVGCSATMRAMYCVLQLTARKPRHIKPDERSHM
eukprot:1416824-Pleurochrysis_carterae.AAC.2